MLNNNPFALYLQSNKNRVQNDPLIDYKLTKKEWKEIKKDFWKSSKEEQPFVQEAKKWRLFSKLTVAQFYIFLVLGAVLIAYSKFDPSYDPNYIALGFGVFFILLSFALVWTFSFYMYKNKPSYYHVILGETYISKNWNTANLFFSLGITCLIGMAFVSAIQKEMIFLITKKEEIKEQ